MLKLSLYFCLHFKIFFPQPKKREKSDISYKYLIFNEICKIKSQTITPVLQKRPFYNPKGALSHAKRNPFRVRKSPFWKTGKAYFRIKKVRICVFIAVFALQKVYFHLRIKLFRQKSTNFFSKNFNLKFNISTHP